MINIPYNSDPNSGHVSPSIVSEAQMLELIQ